MSKSKLYSLATILCASIFMMCTAAAHAQEAVQENLCTLNFEISFARNNSKVDKHFSNNSAQMENLEDFIKGISTIQNITIYSNCSPDGALWRNTQLAQQRGKAVETALISLIEKYGVDLKSKIEVIMLPEDWKGLEKLVDEAYTREDKHQLQQILHSGKNNFVKKKQIMSLSGGESFNTLMAEIMPQLRKSVIITIAVPSYLKDDTFEQLPQMQQHPQQLAKAESKEQIKAIDYSYEYAELESPTVPSKQKEYIFNIKTNLLLPLLNVGIEFPIKEKYTVGVEYYYPWIKPSNNRWCAQMLAWFVEGKYWHTQNHGFGVYTGAGYYDFQDSKSGDQGEFVDVGADYTYSISVGKKKWMKVQFNIGLGYIFTTARHYNPTDDYEHLIKDPSMKRKNSHFVGPTRGGVSLVFPIAKFWKGGDR